LAPGSARPRRLILLSGIAPVLVTAVLALYRPAAFARLEDAAYDVVLRAAGTTPPHPGVVIVDIDERSLESVGQWPWRRDVIGELLTRLRDAGASVIAIDIMFAEPDRSGIPRTSATAPATTPDEALARAVGNAPVVLGYGLVFDRAAPAKRPCLLHPAPLALSQAANVATHTPVFQATGAVCNLPVIAKAATRSGFLNAAPDRDGILRRVPLLAEFDGVVYPGLALSAVSASLGAGQLGLHVSTVNASSLSIGERTVPLDGRSNLLLAYRGTKRTFPYFSAGDIMAGKIGAEDVHGKIVFVGTTALGTREVVATPLDTQFVGIEVQATTADNLLQQDFIHRSPFGAALDGGVVVATGIAMAALLAWTGIVGGLLAGVAGVVGLWWGAAALLAGSRLFVSPLWPTVGILASLAAMTLAKIKVERSRADHESRDKTAAQRLMVQTLLSLTETRDAETGRHSRRTQEYARLLAESLATDPAHRSYFTRDRIDLLSSLAPLHDIGKVGISDRILNKPGALDAEELSEMRRHPELGRDVILKAEARVGVRDDATLQLAKDIVYTHHERWDGTGYPQGLHGTDIPAAGRLMAVVDVYDAVRARSLYNSCRSHEDTVAVIVEGKGTHFDPAVVDAFLRVAPLFEAVSDEVLTDGAAAVK
jgi:CHASE2 domain-containing sensor protein